MSKEKLIQLQFALFFEEMDNRPDKFINKIDEALDGVFDQMPTILPIPADAPPEIPSVTMQSSNGLYVCNIAKNRIDFVMNCINSGDSASVIFENFISKIRLFSNVVFGSKNIIRFGFIGRYFYKRNDPAKVIQSKYFKDDLGELEEINLRFNKRFESNDLSFNDVVEISKGSVSENNGPEQYGIVIQRDMNNIPVVSLQKEDMLSVIKSREDNFKLSGISELVL
ncbi:MULTISPECIES: hypothetical protein [unclassified Peribacillus]|uniref:hypothetical protein n=1 Tax=unclassified Peribacillus TaxID=2675266 RepID=UPI00366F5D4E